MKILYEKQADKYLRSLTDDWQIRLEKAINAIPKGDIVSMQGRNNMYRLRVGKYRVIFSKDGNTIYILRIASRGDVYKK